MLQIYKEFKLATMLSLLYYLIQIRFRKHIAKDDYSAMLLIAGLYICIAIIGFVQYEKVRGVFFIVFIDVFFYHINRKDIEILCNYKYYKLLIWLEYLFYSIPFFAVVFIKGDIIEGIIIMLGYGLLIQLPKRKRYVLKYPFMLVNPFWHISFRKLKLLWVLPFVFLLCVMGYLRHNEGLITASFIVIGVVSCMPSSKRERDIEVKISCLSAESYLQKQLKNEALNTLILVLPLFVLICVLFFDWNYILCTCLVIILPIGNTIVKYAFFESELKQQLFIASCFIGFGIPMLSLPFLYNRAIRQLNQIKHVES